MKYLYRGIEILWDDKFKCPLCGKDTLFKKDTKCAKKRYLVCADKNCTFNSNSMVVIDEE